MTPDILPVPSHAKHRTPPLPAQEVQTSGSPLSPLAMAAPPAARTAPPMITSCIKEGSVALHTCRGVSLGGAIGRRLWRLSGRFEEKEVERSQWVDAIVAPRGPVAAGRSSIFNSLCDKV